MTSTDIHEGLDAARVAFGNWTEPGEAGLEPVIDPDLPIVDAHHHLWPSGDKIPYDIDDIRRDIGSSHNVTDTVFAECMASFRSGGDVALRPVGETEFLVKADPRKIPGRPWIAAGIVGWADLRMPHVAQKTIEAHIEAGQGRFKGVRHNVLWHADTAFAGPRSLPRYLLRDPAFREGLAVVARHHLTYDVWMFHEQLPELVEVLDALPELTVILDHLGGPVSPDVTAAGRRAVFDHWRGQLTELARRPNIVLKLGGLGMPVFGFGFAHRDRPAPASELEAAWRPFVETAIEAFGPERCLFESNFPVDRVSCSYRTLWNVYKRITQGFSADERGALFSGTARRVYRLDT